MKPLRTLFCLCVVVFTACQKANWESETQSCTPTVVLNTEHSKAVRLKQQLEKMQAAGIPGVVIAIHDTEGYWGTAVGLAKIEDKTPMALCHLQYGQSVAKTYMATECLLLQEEGKVDLDQSISAYLPSDVTAMIDRAEEITVRMLLQHRSGIPEYNDKPEYVTYLLQHPLHTFTPLDYLGFVEGKPLVFEPNAQYRYTNTNYILLALIADELTGDHAKYMKEKIFQPHGLGDTYYHTPGFLDQPQVVNTYWDRYSNGTIENCSDMQKTNVASLIGDDGIVATPIDYINFLQQLLEGDILQAASLDDMQTFLPQKEGEKDGYGLGLHRDYVDGHAEMGHSGGGIGSGCLLGYFPDSDTYYFIGMNIGTSIYSPNFDPIEGILDEMYAILLE